MKKRCEYFHCSAPASTCDKCTVPERPEEKTTCTWTLDMTDSGVFDTDCGNMFEVECGTPLENEMRFCCYCGKPIIEDLEAAGNDEDEEEE